MAIENSPKKTTIKIPRSAKTATVVGTHDLSKKSIPGRIAKHASTGQAKALKSVKAGTVTRFRDSAEPATSVTIIRLSDPVMKKTMANAVKRLSTDRDEALRFLREIGIATPTGRLSKRYGG